jgi:hypothetical protein
VFERWETVAAMEDPAGYLHRTAMNLFRNHAGSSRILAVVVSAFDRDFNQAVEAATPVLDSLEFHTP